MNTGVTLHFVSGAISHYSIDEWQKHMKKLNIDRGIVQEGLLKPTQSNIGNCFKKESSKLIFNNRCFPNAWGYTPMMLEKSEVSRVYKDQKEGITVYNPLGCFDGFPDWTDDSNSQGCFDHRKMGRAGVYPYFKDEFGVYYYTKCAALPCTARVTSGNTGSIISIQGDKEYVLYVNGNDVYYEGVKLEGLSSYDTILVGGYFITDNKYIWDEYGHKLKISDPNNFRFLGNNLYVDKKSCYLISWMGLNTLEGCDPLRIMYHNETDISDGNLRWNSYGELIKN